MGKTRANLGIQTLKGFDILNKELDVVDKGQRKNMTKGWTKAFGVLGKNLRYKKK